MNNGEYYIYVSTRADYDPAKMIFVCPPAVQAKDVALARRFSQDSGWQTLAEYDGAVLVVPTAPEGWQAQDTSLPGVLYDTLRNEFSSRNGHSLYGRGGKLWCWETLVYLAGYGDGAVFAGNCAVAHPGRFAAVALVGGAPDDYSAAKAPSEHSFLRQVSEDYHPTNNQIASCVWMLGAPAGAAQTACKYFAAVAGADREENTQIEGVAAKRRFNAASPAQQVLVSEGDFTFDLQLNLKILNGLFDRIIRWKNGPDGLLSFHPDRVEYYTSGRFVIGSVCVNALDYPYGVYLPAGMTREQAAGMPLVFSIHGRGEPAWLFCTKNGWDTLADETRAFVLAVPDSPGNIWQLNRDGAAFVAMVEKICNDYQLDRTRVYLTGFSNGASITREVGTRYPELFAGISPWNGPLKAPGLVDHQVVNARLLEEGYEMPCWICAGDRDPVTAPTDAADQLGPLLQANHCPAAPCNDPCGYAADEVRGADYYTASKGYAEGERFCTRVFRDNTGAARVAYTVMKNMPHGAIQEQSRAAWEFLRVFRRPLGSKAVEILSAP